MSLSYIIGLICGLSVGLLAYYRFMKYWKKSKALAGAKDFDERQEHFRGVGYKYGFYTLCLYMVAIGILELFLPQLPGDLISILFLGICLGFTVFAVTCIRNDAYLALWEKPKTVIITFAAMSLYNIIIGAVNVHNSENPGFLSFHYVNFICGIMLLIVLLVFIVYYIRYKNNQDDRD